MAKGCGCQTGLLRYVKPPYSKLFYAACCIHDDDYDRGGGKAERRDADRRLFDNCLTIVSRQSAGPWRKAWMAQMALAFWVSVRLFGRAYFNYT